jgi:cyclopropane fatty-acyl-phospholipid synthase-like methyltransferase
LKGDYINLGSKIKVSSRRVGLDIGLAIGRFFLNTEDLHYGYWPKGRTATIQNFVEAQEAHSKLIMDHIPNKTKRILDVGSGSGNLAMKLINKGFQVDCVIPSEFLAEQVQAKLGDRSTIHICGFESVSDSEMYDLILFSESFQYVKLGKSLEKISNMLTLGGHLLICDFFKRNGVGKSPIGGGHDWQLFQKKISTHPLGLISDLDITEETAPTIDLFAKFNADVFTPIAEMSSEYLIDHYPKLSKLFRWKFKKRLEKIHDKYLTGSVNGHSFQQFKEYHFLVYKKV